MTAAVAIAVVALVAVVLIAVLPLAGARAGPRRPGRDGAPRAVLDDVKDVAWNNRDVAPDLSTIVIDTIRTGEERLGRRELPN